MEPQGHGVPRGRAAAFHRSGLDQLRCAGQGGEDRGGLRGLHASGHVQTCHVFQARRVWGRICFKFGVSFSLTWVAIGGAGGAELVLLMVMMVTICVLWVIGSFYPLAPPCSIMDDVVFISY